MTKKNATNSLSSQYSGTVNSSWLDGLYLDFLSPPLWLGRSFQISIHLAYYIMIVISISSRWFLGKNQEENALQTSTEETTSPLSVHLKSMVVLMFWILSWIVCTILRYCEIQPTKVISVHLCWQMSVARYKTEVCADFDNCYFMIWKNECFFNLWWVKLKSCTFLAHRYGSNELNIPKAKSFKKRTANHTHQQFIVSRIFINVSRNNSTHICYVFAKLGF